MTFPDEDEREASLATFAFCAAHHCYHPPPARTSQHPAPSSSKMCSAALSARCGGMTALGVAVGGCLTLLMLQVRPLIEAGRLLCRSTCTDTDWLCERMKECVSKHAALIPVVVALVAYSTTQHQACAALNGLVEILQDDIKDYLALLTECFFGLLETVPLTSRRLSLARLRSRRVASSCADVGQTRASPHPVRRRGQRSLLWVQ